MKKVILQQQDLADGSVSFTITCGLEQVNDVSHNTVDNPIRTLVWNPFLQRYILSPLEGWEEDPNRPLRMNVPEPDEVLVDLPPPTSDDESTIQARECWCARVFQQDAHDNTNDALDVTQNALFCPLDTNVDGKVNKRDVRICTARALYSAEGALVERESACYSETPMTEFAKSSWPLCFFWWILLMYALMATAYGRRVRMYMYRNLVVKLVCLRDAFTARRRRTNRGDEENIGTGAVGTGDEGEGGGEDRGASPADGDRQEDDIDIETAQGVGDDDQPRPEPPSIEELFGCHENYDLLGRELVYQAEQTNNEYITWLWYSAIYSEVRRYRYEQWREQRDRRRARRHRLRHRGNITNTVGEGDEDPTETEATDGGGMLGGRVLDRVYWWPPSGPEGTRWEHLRRRNDNGNPDSSTLDPSLDPTKLCLKTKIFSLSGLDTNENESFTKKKDSKDKDPTEGSDNGASASAATIATEEASVPATDGSTSTPSGTEEIQRAANTPIHDDEQENGDNDNNNNNNNNNDGETDEVVEKLLSATDNFNDDIVDDSEIPDNICSICLCELEEGDVMGDIPCGHRFHKECLKAWLIKNNHCPICRMPDIAYYPKKGQCPPIRQRPDAQEMARRESGPPQQTLTVLARFEAEPL